MMYINKTGGAYSSSIATIIDGFIVLNWNNKNVGELKKTQSENSYFNHEQKENLIKKILQWFHDKNKKH